MNYKFFFLAILIWPPLDAQALEYPYSTAEPQKTGWPLTEDEKRYVLLPEYDRRPGREAQKHLPGLWPQVPSAGYWGGTAWLDMHAKLVEYVKANPGPCDVLLVGDSITQQWGRPLDKVLLERGLGGEIVLPKYSSASTPVAPAPRSTLDPSAVRSASATLTAKALQPTPKTADGKALVYPYTPYNEGKMDPQLTGWPLTDAERAWVNKGEYFRKPGHETQKHLPEMWFVTPTAAHWQTNEGKEGNAWIDHHATNIEKVKAVGARIDIALLGDSITQGWGGGWDGAPWNAVWLKCFGNYKTVNLGIGGDRIENILWRLDHGALDGVSPQVVVVMIGVNNAPLVHANGVSAISAAHGIKLCIENLRQRCPQSEIVMVKILPAFDPRSGVGAKVREINAGLDALKLTADPHVHELDLWNDFTNSDGTLKTALYSDGHLHLNLPGYEIFADRLQQAVQRLVR